MIPQLAAAILSESKNSYGGIIKKRSIKFQISPACGPNTYQITYGDILDCQRQ